MKKAACLILLLSLTGLAPLLSQETAAAPPPQAKDMLTVPTGFTYNPEGRRDPFRDLMAGRGRGEKPSGGPEILIDDLILFGIVKNQNVFTAMIGLPQGFPMFVKVGDKFTDGFVLSITESQVVLRKTHERGIPLIRPRDVIKEITEEL